MQNEKCPKWYFLARCNCFVLFFKKGPANERLAWDLTSSSIILKKMASCCANFAHYKHCGEKIQITINKALINWHFCIK